MYGHLCHGFVLPPTRNLGRANQIAVLINVTYNHVIAKFFAPMTMTGKDYVSAAVAKATLQLGYKELRPAQALVVKRFVSGFNLFVSMPREAGSCCAIAYCLRSSTFFEAACQLRPIW